MWKDLQVQSEQKRSNRVELKVNDKAKFLETTLKPLEKGDDPASLFKALLLACGRRPTTLHLTIDDRWVIDDETKNEIWYREKLKKRGRVGKVKGSVIPLLCSAGIFINALRRFQVLVHTQDQRNRVCESNAQLMFGSLHRSWCEGCGFRPRDFRALYAAYVGSNGDVRAGLTVPTTISRALLHVHPVTALSYMRIDLQEKSS